MKNTAEFQEYRILSIHKDYALILGTSFENPLSDLSPIEKDLNDAGYKGNVVFDLLLSNGKSSNRFICLDFKKGVFERSTLKVLSQVDDNLLEKSREFFSQNKELLFHGVLTEQERFSILYP